MARRQFCLAVACMKTHMAVAPALGIDQAFERGRRRGKNDGKFAERAIDDRHVAGMIRNAVLLLVGALVLLIDDNEAELCPGQEQSRARADDDLRRPFRHRAPGSLALARPEARMPLCRLGTETTL